MALAEKELTRIADLARLTVAPEALPRLSAELTRILELVEEMDAVDTAGLAPMAHPLDALQRLRPDVPCEPDQRDLFQDQAPAVQAGLYVVPRVLE